VSASVNGSGRAEAVAADLSITFRCPPEWADVLPSPEPAREQLPDWLRDMPATAHSALLGNNVRTVKQCPPFVDAMGSGWIMPLAADVTVEDGCFSWDWDLPPARFERLARSPLGLHVSAQAAGSPLAQPGELFVKFNNFWAIEVPDGYSVLFGHPANRPDLPFRSLTGMVDCDRFSHGLVHFPAVWHDRDFSGCLPKGTPVAQLWLVPRSVDMRVATLDGDDAQRFEDVQAMISDQPAGYRKSFRAKGR